MILKDYECLLILKPDLSEDDVTGVVSLVTNQITPNGGSIIEEDRWGKRRLAYTVKKQKYGYYLLLRYAGAAADVEEIERSFRFSDLVLKFLTVYFDEAAGRIPEGAEPRVARTDDRDDD